MFLPSHLHTGSGSNQKLPAPTGSCSAALQCYITENLVVVKNGADKLIIVVVLDVVVQGNPAINPRKK